MKTAFMEDVRADTPEDALRVIGAKYGKTGYRIVEDSLPSVLAQVRTKLGRVLMNPTLYADKIAEYKAILAWAEKASGTPQDVARAMIEHGDVRVDNPHTICLTAQGGRKWLAFGYHFTR